MGKYSILFDQNTPKKGITRSRFPYFLASLVPKKRREIDITAHHRLIQAKKSKTGILCVIFGDLSKNH